MMKLSDLVRQSSFEDIPPMEVEFQNHRNDDEDNDDDDDDDEDNDDDEDDDSYWSLGDLVLVSPDAVNQKAKRKAHHHHQRPAAPALTMSCLSLSQMLLTSSPMIPSESDRWRSHNKTSKTPAVTSRLHLKDDEDMEALTRHHQQILLEHQAKEHDGQEDDDEYDYENEDDVDNDYHYIGNVNNVDFNKEQENQRDHHHHHHHRRGQRMPPQTMLSQHQQQPHPQHSRAPDGYFRLLKTREALLASPSCPPSDLRYSLQQGKKSMSPEMKEASVSYLQVLALSNKEDDDDNEDVNEDNNVNEDDHDKDDVCDDDANDNEQHPSTQQHHKHEQATGESSYQDTWIIPPTTEYASPPTTKNMITKSTIVVSPSSSNTKSPRTTKTTKTTMTTPTSSFQSPASPSPRSKHMRRRFPSLLLQSSISSLSSSFRNNNKDKQQASKTLNVSSSSSSQSMMMTPKQAAMSPTTPSTMASSTMSWTPPAITTTITTAHDHDNSDSVQDATTTSPNNNTAWMPTNPSILVLLLHEPSKSFELVQLAYHPNDTTVGEALSQIRNQATHASLAEQKYRGLFPVTYYYYHSSNGNNNNNNGTSEDLMGNNQFKDKKDPTMKKNKSSKHRLVAPQEEKVELDVDDVEEEEDDDEDEARQEGPRKERIVQFPNRLYTPESDNLIHHRHDDRDEDSVEMSDSSDEDSSDDEDPDGSNVESMPHTRSTMSSPQTTSTTKSGDGGRNGNRRSSATNNNNNDTSNGKDNENNTPFLKVGPEIAAPCLLLDTVVTPPPRAKASSKALTMTRSSQVFVAISKGTSKEHMVPLAQQILSSPRVRHLISCLTEGTSPIALKTSTHRAKKGSRSGSKGGSKNEKEKKAKKSASSASQKKKPKTGMVIINDHSQRNKAKVRKDVGIPMAPNLAEIASSSGSRPSPRALPTPRRIDPYAYHGRDESS